MIAHGCTPRVFCATQARPGNSNGIPAFQSSAIHDDSPIESEEEEVCGGLTVVKGQVHVHAFLCPQQEEEEHVHVDLEAELGVEFAKDDDEDEVHHGTCGRADVWTVGACNDILHFPTQRRSHHHNQ